ncbi:MAG: DUF512 domain-containing protein [Lachnospiraceae bacterium]|jgi:putative radical SAM enzyme (TIGR03279 family)|nr:DUF512 domain-containing protein [Lachnospiraceae bacterium]
MLYCPYGQKMLTKEKNMLRSPRGKSHQIKEVTANSIAAEMGVEKGDFLLTIDDNNVADVFDYRMMTAATRLEVLIKKPSGEEWLLEIDKEEDEDLGLVFATEMMDEYRSCGNKCIFCFIKQMPPGLRETLYFKDDDTRLSFLQGNYVSLTNLTDEDIDRIIRYRLQPINISIHTSDAKLRTLMMGNPLAGEALAVLDRLFAAEITMNGQIVLCKGINDESKLTQTLDDLVKYLPYLQSVSVVPAGLTKHRNGLYPLVAYDHEDAKKVLALIENYREPLFDQYQNHFVHAADEWYLMAGEYLPPMKAYDNYPQLANGVGMMRLFLDEFAEEMAKSKQKTMISLSAPTVISIATGELAYSYIKMMSAQMEAAFPGLTIHVYPIINHFFGGGVTVSGLLTGEDLTTQLKGCELGERLLLPVNIVSHDRQSLLDGMTVTKLQNALQVTVDIVESSGRDFVKAIIRSK